MMSVPPPKITVAMPVYNGGELLLLAINSVLNQSYQNFEFLILNDGSTDFSKYILKKITDPRVKIIDDGLNLGLANRLNQAISLATGKYFARMDQDDVCFPNRFEKQIEYLEMYSEVDLCAVSAIVIDEKNIIVGMLPVKNTHSEITRRPWLGFYMAHPTWMGKTYWFKKHQYSKSSPYLCEDQELLLRSHKVSVFATLEETLFAYRVKSRTNYWKLIKNYFSVFFVFAKFFISKFEIKNATLTFLLLIVRLSFIFLKTIIKVKKSNNINHTVSDVFQKTISNCIKKA